MDFLTDPMQMTIGNSDDLTANKDITQKFYFDDDMLASVVTAVQVQCHGHRGSHVTASPVTVGRRLMLLIGQEQCATIRFAPSVVSAYFNVLHSSGLCKTHENIHWYS